MPELLASPSRLILVVAIVLFVMQWTVWILGKGRYRHSFTIETRLFPRIAVKVIDDFRHLFALVIVLIFAAVVLGGFILASDTDQFASVLQSSAATTLAGLVGVIVGYYFGNVSAGSGARSPVPAPTQDRSDQHDAGTGQ